MVPLKEDTNVYQDVCTSYDVEQGHFLLKYILLYRWFKKTIYGFIFKQTLDYDALQNMGACRLHGLFFVVENYINIATKHVKCPSTP